MTILLRDFFARDTLKVAKELLGCRLMHKNPATKEVLSGIIVETEAYKQNDPACHAYSGKTKRSKTLFMKPGTSYVYFIYGMYHCINIVTESENTAGAVLIRALEPIPPLKNTNGPGKLCREMKITMDLNELDVTNPESEIVVEEGIKVKNTDIITTTRIGIKSAADYPWRFYIKDNPYVSKK